MKHLEPLIKERLEKEARHGKDWPGKPVSLSLASHSSFPVYWLGDKNDLISWLLETAQGEQRSVRNMTIRILLVNLAAIHTASMVCLIPSSRLKIYSWYPDFYPHAIRLGHKSGIRPADAGWSRSCAPRGRLDSNCHQQTFKSRQLHQRIDAAVWN